MCRAARTGEVQVLALFDNPQVIGLKHTSQDLYALERLRAAYPDKVCFNGFDEMFLAGAGCRR
ncbi:dihydrodipicolinate synthase family protein [Georgenia sp. SUBG003]|uniref:dihydrodipicolinate synthase family protein n=1 Tax=Georgenia sp. SUBG003 TaxID=1497974 RepID=UPI003AB64AF2